MGWTQSDFARAIGVNVAIVGLWFNMKDYPHNPQTMFKICELVGSHPEELFPDLLRDKDWLSLSKETTLYKDVDIEYLPFHRCKELPATGIEDSNMVNEDNLLEFIDSVSMRNNERLKKALYMRYGIEGETSTYKEISNALGCSKTSSQQFVKQAIRILRYVAYRREEAEKSL